MNLLMNLPTPLCEDNENFQYHSDLYIIYRYKMFWLTTVDLKTELLAYDGTSHFKAKNMAYDDDAHF